MNPVFPVAKKSFTWCWLLQTPPGPLMRFYERNGFQPTYQSAIEEFGQTFLCQYYVLRF
ncbi:hypothetical protein ACS5NO_23960 [Larkinella sp. GY13]|uniref:hypothetical protein n=1 Tax=Larkinella sp. GY13 TaxID=3453720 RepID=UPI003EEDCD04